MIKIFISQPMNGLSLEEIVNVRKEYEAKIAKIIPNQFTIIDNLQANMDYIAGAKTHPRLYYLGGSIQLMSEADCLVMVNGWKNSPGCNIEVDIANKYGISVIYDLNDLLKLI